jgi:hypothetical protein
MLTVTPIVVPKDLEVSVSAVVKSRNGWYAVAYQLPGKSPPLPKNESITFSAYSWGGVGKPEKGEVVIVKDIRRFKNGWRALQAIPSTKQQTTA